MKKYRAIIIKENIVYGYNNTYLDKSMNHYIKDPFAYSWKMYIGTFITLDLLKISDKDQKELKKEFKKRYPNTPIFIANDTDNYWKNNVPGDAKRIVQFIYDAQKQIIEYEH